MKDYGIVMDEAITNALCVIMRMIGPQSSPVDYWTISEILLFEEK
jgi:hypothetical protein